MSDDKDIGAQSWQYRFALVKICRNGKGKKRVLSSFFPVPVFSRSFPRTSLVSSDVRERCVVSTVGDVGQKRVITRCHDLGSEP